jgi:hypothetical protein
MGKTGFETYACLSENLNGIMYGDYNHHFKVDELEKAKQIGFLLSNFSIDIDIDKAIFDYEDIVVKIAGMKNISELGFEDYLISLFLRQDDFIRAYKMFERGYKLDKMIK